VWTPSQKNYEIKTHTVSIRPRRQQRRLVPDDRRTGRGDDERFQGGGEGLARPDSGKLEAGLGGVELCCGFVLCWVGLFIRGVSE
jgi:hypothetical protein